MLHPDAVLADVAVAGRAAAAAAAAVAPSLVACRRRPHARRHRPHVVARRADGLVGAHQVRPAPHLAHAAVRRRGGEVVGGPLVMLMRRVMRLRLILLLLLLVVVAALVMPLRSIQAEAVWSALHRVRRRARERVRVPRRRNHRLPRHI